MNIENTSGKPQTLQIYTIRRNISHIGDAFSRAPHGSIQMDIIILCMHMCMRSK